ncbi:MAG: DUF131 domain-containing protein [Candidatus Thermoplasmatota archaeon]
MNKYHFLSLIFLFLGIILTIFGIYIGEIDVGIIVIFPFIVGSGIYGFLGIGCIFLSIVLYFLGFISSFSYENSFYEDVFEKRETPDGDKKSVHGGGIVFIGPIPIIVGSNWKIALILLVTAVIILSVFTAMTVL